MSEAEAVQKPDEEEPDQEADTEGKPDVEADEMAAVPDDLAERVEAETTPESDEDQEADGEEADEEQAAASPSTVDPGMESPDGESWGDWYVGTLTGACNDIINEFGDESTEEIDEAFARQIGLDDAVDEFMESQGMPEMAPEQQILLGTLIFAAGVTIWKTDLLSELLADSDLSP